MGALPSVPRTTTTSLAASSTIRSSLAASVSSVVPSISAVSSVSRSASFSSAVPSASAIANSTISIPAAQSIDSTILVLARDATSGSMVTLGLQGYGIPYQVIIVPQEGVTLPALNSSLSQGNYGGILVLSELSYNYAAGWGSALTADQWNIIYAYQSTFKVRMTRLDVYPGPAFGATAVGGCCNAGVSQDMYFSNATGFATAGLKTGIAAGVKTEGLYHYPASITDATIATEIAAFKPSSDGTIPGTTTAAVINNFSGREQMVFFIGWANDWSATSMYLSHAWIQWMTRGMYAGQRRTYFNTQVDDVGLPTGMYRPVGAIYRSTPADLNGHVAWLKNLNTRLPAGSSYFMEMGHNGFGYIDPNVMTTTNCGFTNPELDFGVQNDTALEFQKPLGTGTNVWPSAYYSPASISTLCQTNDTLLKWFQVAANRDTFSHMSHTFTHYELNNATNIDAGLEIKFNLNLLKNFGLSAGKWSTGLIPPAITGLHNGDVIKAWMDNGIKYVVGDNTRAPLVNTQNQHWPLITNVANNGFDGLTVIPRWATHIYYNCDTEACDVQEWIDTSAGKGNFTDMLDIVRNTNTRYLFGLRHDPYMFHQANMRVDDMPITTVGSRTAKHGLLMSWVETVLQEYVRLVDWPVITKKHDDLGKIYTDRMTREQCGYKLAYTYKNAAGSTTITGGTLTATGNSCGAPIPVTFPVKATTTAAGTTTEQIGSDPLTIWVPLSGAPVTFTLTTPLKI